MARVLSISVMSRRLARVLSISARRLARVLSISARRLARVLSVVSRRVGRVDLECCLCRDFGRVASCRSCRVVSVVSRPVGRVGRVASCRSCRVETRGANTKKARFLNRGIGLSYRKASRALNLPLAPLSNTRAIARSVRLGLARRSCIVMPTSDRRHIGSYI